MLYQLASCFSFFGKSLVIASSVLMVACAQQPSVQSGSDAEKLGDNLYKIDNAKVKEAYVDPDADFSAYTKIILAPLDLENVNIIQPSKGSFNHKEWTLEERDKDTLSERYQAIMVKYLQEDKPDNPGYQIVTEAGEGVLVVSASIIALAPSAPKDDGRSRSIGRSYVFTQSAGTMTIGLLVSDAQTGKSLITAADKRSGWGNYSRNNRATNLADVNLVFGNWANKLRHSLDHISDIM